MHARTHTQSDCSSALEVLPVSKRAATHTEFFKQTLHVGVDLSAALPVSAPARPAQQPRRQRSSRGVSGFPGAPTLAPRHSPDTVSVTPTCPWDGSAWVLPLRSVRLPWGSVAMSPPAVRRFDPWLGKIPWRREWQPTPVFLSGESHGQRSLVSYSPWGCRVGHD